MACRPSWLPWAWTNSPDGTEVYVDGAAGSITADPDDSLRAAADAWAATASLLAEFSGTGTTADGHLVPLLANVGGGKDAEAAAKLGAQGVGLFRTEFCFLERDYRTQRGGAGRGLQERV